MRIETPLVGLRAAKKEATKLAIVGAALDLFELQGFEGTSIDEIVAKAGIGRSTFFRYFETKEDVVLDSRWDGARLRCMLAERPTGESPCRSVRLALEQVMEHFHVERKRMRKQVRIIKSVEALRLRHFYRVTLWERIIAEFVAARRGTHHSEDPYAMAIGIAASGAVRAAFYAWDEGRGHRALPETFRAMMDTFAAGLEKPPKL